MRLIQVLFQYESGQGELLDQMRSRFNHFYPPDYPKSVIRFWYGESVLYNKMELDILVDFFCHLPAWDIRCLKMEEVIINEGD